MNAGLSALFLRLFEFGRAMSFGFSPQADLYFSGTRWRDREG
jgi:hypothetical protein